MSKKDFVPQMPHPLVSVVIPTRNRPDLVQRAVQSALAQTYPHLEVLVVIDGPDEKTASLLASMAEQRVRVISLKESVGGSEARNTGVREADGEWIAFLDDDDAWMPRKIELQLACATQSCSSYPVIACRIIGRTPGRDYVWPARFPATNEPLSEYLFNRKTWFRGEGQLQTSMIFTKKALMLEVPFTKGLPRHQDTDWYVRIGARTDASVEFVESEPLAIWYLDENRASIVKINQWERSREWLNSVRSLITPRAYAGFIATQLAREAAAQGSFRGFFQLLRDMIKFGRPGQMDVVLYFGQWLLPGSLRSSVRRLLSRST